MAKMKHEKRGASAPEAAPPAATEKPAGGKPKEPAKAAAQASGETDTSAGEIVTIIKTNTAQKLSPRGDGALTYNVGRIGDTVFVRLAANSSSGSHSKEWVALKAIRRALADASQGAASFKGAPQLNAAFVGRSSTNGGFLCAVLVAEGLLVRDAEKKGMLSLASATALDSWERAMLAVKLPKDAEKLPLHPPKVVPSFGKREQSPAKFRCADESKAHGTGTEKNSVLEVTPTATGDDAPPQDEGG